MVKLRLKRIGKKQKPFYRIVAADSRVNRNGQYIELVGTFDPLKNEIKLDKELALSWLQKGAQPTDTVRDLLSKEGVMKSLHEAKLENKNKEISKTEKPKAAPVKKAAPKVAKKVEAPKVEEVKKEEVKVTPKPKTVKVTKVSEEEKEKAKEFLAKAETKYSEHLNEENEATSKEHAKLSTNERSKVDGSESIDETRSELQKHANSLRSHGAESKLDEKILNANLRDMTKKELIKYMKKIRTSLEK